MYDVVHKALLKHDHNKMAALAKQMAVKKQDHVLNLTNFIKYLPQTYIKFIFFKASNMDRPIVATVLRKHKEWYITPGQESNYVYAYTESDLKYMVTKMRVKDRTTMLYNAKVNRLTPTTHAKDVAYLGNHIDFHVECNHTCVYFNAHWTEYLEDVTNANNFKRNADDSCNFLTGEKNFVKTMCVNRNNDPLHQISSIFLEKAQLSIIEDLWKATNGHTFKRGQPGGSPQEPRGYKSYKGVNIMTPEFYTFMNKSIFQELFNNTHRNRHTPEYVYQYFDEGNDLLQDGNKSVQYVIEFEENRTIAFSISSHRALKACWTSMNKNMASNREKRALGIWNRACKELVNTDFDATT